MRKKFKVLDYGVAVVVALGCTMFFLTGDIKPGPVSKSNALT